MAHGIDVTGPITPEQQTAVETLLRQRTLPARPRERLEMVKAAWLGADVDAIARWSGRTPRTVRRWLTAFRDGGVEALADAPIPGRPPKADATYLAVLATAVDTPPRALDLPFDVWSSRRLSAYLEAQTGIRIAPGWLRVVLHRERFACGRPKHTLAHLQDPTEVAACARAIQAAGEKGAGAAGALRVALRG
jgi:transposase